MTEPLTETLTEPLPTAPEATEPTDETAVLVRRGGDELPIFCFPEPGDALRYVQRLLPHLDDRIPVYGLPVPRSGHVRLRTVEGHAARFVRMIQAVQPRGPYRLLGTSIGGAFANETARQLAGQDQTVEFLGQLDLPLGDDGTAGDWRREPSIALVGAVEADTQDAWLCRVIARYVARPLGTSIQRFAMTDSMTAGAAVSRAIDVAAAGRHAKGQQPYWPLMLIRPGRGNAASAYCIPGAGASVTVFTELAGYLDPAIAVHGLQPRGMDGRDVPHVSAQSAARAYITAMQSTRPNGPLHLIGHSFGGWVAFEIALRLRRAGVEVASLTIVDIEGPGLSGDAVPEYDDAEVFQALVEVIELGAERSLGLDLAGLGLADDATRLQALHAALVREGLMPRRSVPDVLEGPRATFAACIRSAYTPAGAYDGPMHLILVDDGRVDEGTNRSRHEETVAQWRRWAPRVVPSRGPGNHVTVLKSPHVAELAAHLTSYMAP